MFSYAQRKSLPKKDFAIPAKKNAENPAGKGGYPIPDNTARQLRKPQCVPKSTQSFRR